MEEIVGHIERITYQNAENGWTVARMQESKKIELTVVVGPMPSIQVGETVRCKGIWKNDLNFGYQFQAKEYRVERPASVYGITKYLGSGMIKGIGSVFAERIVSYHGEKTLEVIDNDPDKLLEIDGIGAKRIARIKQSWHEQRAIREVMVYLQQYGVSPTYAQKIFKTYEERSIPIIKDNPYQLARDIWGIGFKTADQIAQNIGIEKNAEIRIDSGIEYALNELANNGHTCYPIDKFLEKGQELLEVESSLIDERLEFITNDNRIVLAPLEIEKENLACIWLQSFYACEQGITKELKRLQINSPMLKAVDIEKSIDWAQEALHISLEKTQQLAVAESITNKIHIITGGPGTGKSTITKVILKISKELTGEILLAAPTGRAAKRLSSITKMPAYTIHSLLQYDFSISGFRKNKENPLDCQLLIVDEASMIDTVLMYSLLKALPDNAKLILVGDIDQLPSVGAGNVLNDFIASKRISVTKLTKIFRQAEHSKIILNAHRINAGEYPDTKIEKEGDFFFIPEEDTDKIVKWIMDMVQTRLPQKYKLDAFDDIQVLSPMKRGVIGTRNLNLQLQKTLNPSKEPLIKMGRSFHLHDKVMQIQNNYDKEVFNGDVGRIQKIDRIEQQLIVKIDKKDIVYDYSEIDQLVLAYAISVHKFQGSECPCIIMPVHTSHFNMLYRNLLYTGVTRGKSLVILVGNKQALSMAVKNNKIAKRYTGLKQAIEKNR